MRQEIVDVNAKIASFLLVKKKRVDEMKNLVLEVKSRYLAVESLFVNENPILLEAAF